MMDPFANNVPLWDLSQSTFPSLPDDDFLALLQKEFPNTNGGVPDFAALADLGADGTDGGHADPDGINPQLTALSVPLAGNQTPPLTDDSSPSPPASAQEPPSATSRRHSGSYDSDGLKRKASDDDLTDSGAHKHSHGDRSSSNFPRGRKSTGNPAQDQVRMLRRKEQNRAAQRAFRERKEKHVKDLEDKVAALEDVNRETLSENENLRDLLSRLQEENTMLKQTAFTFSVPRSGGGGGASADVSSSAGAQSAFGQAGPSTAPAAPAPQSQPAPAQPTADIDWANLTTFDPSALNMLDEPADVNMDFAAPGTARSPYKTIASNPMYMSFAEPFGGWDATLAGINATPGTQPNSQPGSNAPSHQNSFDINSFGSWTGGGGGSFEELFGMQSMDMGGLVPSPSQISPVAHTGVNARPGLTTGASSSSGSSSSSSSSPGPFAFTSGGNRSPGAQSLLSLSSELSSPPSSSAAGSPSTSANGGNTGAQHNSGSCPRTKADFAAHIANTISSPFAPDLPRPGTASNKGSPREGVSSAIKKTAGDGKDGGQISCQGSVFPKTEKSERNVEVLQAWRSITSNPQFKDVDINELCAEFTNKAKCDGTKVVLDPQGVHQIIDKFTRTGA